MIAPSGAPRGGFQGSASHGGGFAGGMEGHEAENAGWSRGYLHEGTCSIIYWPPKNSNTLSKTSSTGLQGETGGEKPLI